MTVNKKYFLFAMLITALLLSSCTGRLDEIDTTPLVFEEPGEVGEVKKAVTEEKEPTFELAEDKTLPYYVFDTSPQIAMFEFAKEVGGQDLIRIEDEDRQQQANVESYPAQILAIVNDERAKAGLGALTMTAELNACAQKRAEELVVHYGHDRPNGTMCFTILAENGISYQWAGENIAAGQRSPSEVMGSWMHSQGHRANILNADFNHIGIGAVYVNNGGYELYWVQVFTD